MLRSLGKMMSGASKRGKSRGPDGDRTPGEELEVGSSQGRESFSSAAPGDAGAAETDTPAVPPSEGRTSARRAARATPGTEVAPVEMRTGAHDRTGAHSPPISAARAAAEESAAEEAATPDSLGGEASTPMSMPSHGSPAPPNAMSPVATSVTSADGVKMFDIDDMIARLLDSGYSTKLPKLALKIPEILAVCQAAREVFLNQPTLIELSPPVKIVGDTHGQYQDLLRLFDMCGYPPAANYLLLGDYVDRGKQSLETILLLLCYKIKYPENFFLLRGNHECANVTRVYGFYDECKRRVNIKIWKTFIDVFNTMPIAAIVASKIFCVHGGLSPSLSNMEDILRIERPTGVPDYGLLNDLLWSDPSDTALDWEDNERGVSYCFGKAVIQQFLAQYDFDLICRAHMVVEDGYEFWNDRTLVTIFSAPNYCGGACLGAYRD